MLKNETKVLWQLNLLMHIVGFESLQFDENDL